MYMSPAISQSRQTRSIPGRTPQSEPPHRRKRISEASPGLTRASPAAYCEAKLGPERKRGQG